LVLILSLTPLFNRCARCPFLRYTLVTIIHADDYEWLKHEKFQAMAEAYVVDSPSSTHLDEKWARYHGVDEGNCGNCDGLGEDKGGSEGFVEFANMTEPPLPPRGSQFHMVSKVCSYSPKR
jgi:hypothetical protein